MRQHQTGFTLVELLIALALTSIIMLLLFSGLRLGSRAWDSVDQVTEQVNELRVARQFIERTLRQTREITVNLEGQRHTVFAGDQTRLELVAPLSDQVGIPGLYVLRFELEATTGDHQRLVMTRWLLHPDVLNGSGDYPAWEPLLDRFGSAPSGDGLDQEIAAGAYGRTVLLPEVGTFELGYFGESPRVGQQLEPEWLETWDNQSLPQQVLLYLTTPQQDWPATQVTLPGAPPMMSFY